MAKSFAQFDARAVRSEYGTFGQKLSLLAGTILALAPVQGMAQDQPEKNANENDNVVVLDTITVTGQGVPEPYPGGQVSRENHLGVLGSGSIFDTPFNATTITEQAIRNQQGSSLASVVQDNPSLRNVGTTSQATQLFFIRGFMVQSQDVAYNGLYGIFPYWKGSVASAESVTVLNGPATFLYGMPPSGGIGGNINIMPKRAGDDPITRVTNTYTSTANFGTHVDVGRRFGVDNQFGIRFNGVYQNGETFRDNRPRLGEASLGLDYRGDRLRLSADLGYIKNDGKGFEGSLLSSDTIIPKAPTASHRFFPSWSYWNDESVYGMVRGEYDLTDNITVFGALGARRYDGDYLGAFGRNLDRFGNFTGYFTYQNQLLNTVSGEVGARANFSTGPIDHRLVIAGSGFSSNTDSVTTALSTYQSNIYDSYNLGRIFLPDRGGRKRVSESDLRSLAITDTLSMWDDRVQLTLGGRLQDIQADNINATTGVLTSSYSQSRITPALGLIVKPWESVSIYANYVEGLTQGAIAPTGTINAGEAFAPFVSKQVEAGVKFDFGKVGVTAGVFQITQPSGFIDSSNYYVVNGEQRNRGVELNVFGEPMEGLRVLGGVMLLDATLTNTANGLNDGNRPVNAPKWNVNLGVEWDTPMVPGLTLTARGIHTASSFANQANTQEVDGWTRFDVGARYKFERADGRPITIRANVENVFNKAYWSSAYLYRGAPRTFTLSAAFDF